MSGYEAVVEHVISTPEERKVRRDNRFIVSWNWEPVEPRATERSAASVPAEARANAPAHVARWM